MQRYFLKIIELDILNLAYWKKFNEVEDIEDKIDSQILEDAISDWSIQRADLMQEKKMRKKLRRQEDTLSLGVQFQTNWRKLEEVYPDEDDGDEEDFYN